MPDFNSSLPVRTQSNGDVVINVADGTTETQLLGVDSSGRVTVKLDDGSGNVVTSQTNGAQRALDVGIDVAGVQVDPRQIRALTAADIVTANQGTANTSANGWPVKITDGTNVAGVSPASTAAVATQPAQVVGLSPNSPLPVGSNLLGKIEITDGTSVVGVTPASTAAIATQPAEVVALSPNTPLPAGTNALGSVLANIQVANSPVTAANPVPVTITSSSPGVPIQSAQTSASLAAGASATLTYTVPAGHTFSLERVYSSASGKIKAVVQNGATTIFVGFNSAANPNIDMTVIAPPTIAAAGTVNVVITNEDKAAFDVYATIEGNQIT